MAREIAEFEQSEKEHAEKEEKDQAAAVRQSLTVPESVPSGTPST